MLHLAQLSSARAEHMAQLSTARAELDTALLRSRGREAEAEAGRSEAERGASALREAVRRHEGEAAGMGEQLHVLGSELAAKTTELARHQLDLTRSSALLEGERM